MADADANRLVRELKAQGWSGAEIGRAIDRDASRVNQIARNVRGPGYGAHDVPALRQLAAGQPVQPPERRTSVTGEPARTRRPVVQTPAGRLISTTTLDRVTIRRELERAMSQGEHVYADIRTQQGTRATGWRKWGLRPQVLLGLIESGESSMESIRDLEGIAYLEDGDQIATVDLTIAPPSEGVL